MFQYYNNYTIIMTTSSIKMLPPSLPLSLPLIPFISNRRFKSNTNYPDFRLVLIVARKI